MDIDPWHYTGSKKYINDEGKKLIKVVKRKLKEVEMPIWTGNTGYIHHKPIKDIEGWTTDELGRLVFVYNNMLYFQRYTIGEVFVCQELNEYTNRSGGYFSLVEPEHIQELIAMFKTI